jgi:hypothetical protein
MFSAMSTTSTKTNDNTDKAKPASRRAAAKPKAKAPTTDPIEGAIRKYLLLIDDPAQLVDTKAIEAAEQEVAKATDPIDKLKALAALDKAKNVDAEPIKTAFFEHAKAWAETEGINEDAFRSLGVPVEDLRMAGYNLSPALATKPKGKTVKTVNGADRRRAPAVPVDKIQGWVRSRTKGFEFTLAEMIEQVGSSQATCRKALDELEKNGEVTKEAMKVHTGRGRAPIVYTYTGKTKAETAAA